MALDRHGERFIEVGQFVHYCDGLNVRTSKSELEGYELSGKMLPVARVVYPVEYAKQISEGAPVPGDWPEVTRLMVDPLYHTPPGILKNLSSRNILHPFDREMGRNNLLMRPSAENYRPWNSYPALGVEHYYAYWQAYKLYAFKHPMNINFESFEWLSCWVSVFKRERYRTFSVAPPNMSSLGRRLKKCATLVQKRFNLDKETYYRCLRQLVDMYADYRRDERFHLAGMIQKDSMRLAELIHFNTGELIDQISDALADFVSLHSNDSAWYRETFRNFDPATRERDTAKRVIMRMSKAISPDGIDALLVYCTKNGFPLVAALNGMEATGSKEFMEKSRDVTKHTNLKDILTSMEYLVKESMKVAYPENQNTGLVPSIQKLMKKSNFITWFNKKLQIKGTTNGSLDNIKQLLNSEFGSLEAKKLLVACAARNYVVHIPPNEPELYRHLFEEIVEAAVTSILLIWKEASERNWVG